MIYVGAYPEELGGTTGSEGDGGSLFMTDNPEYAATYVRDGGTVQQMTISRGTLNQMYHNGDVTINTGYNISSGSTIPHVEYQFPSHLKTNIVNNFKSVVP